MKKEALGERECDARKWFYVALARTAAESPSRRRVRGEAEEESKGAVVMGTTTTTMMTWNSEGSLPYFGFVLRTCGCGCGMRRVWCVLCVFLWDGVRLVL